MLTHTVALALLTAATACMAAQESRMASLTVDGERATVRGVVDDNVKRCEVDGACRLVLRAAQGLVNVEYHHGEFPRCDNAEVTAIGLGIAKGDTVEASGRYSKRAAVHLVDVCCPDCRLTVTKKP